VCGICGVVPSDPTRSVDAGLLERMAATLRHRGPDSGGFHRAPGVGLGVRRLSIVDLDTGDQPITNEDGTVVIVCNGEIYNAPELRAELEAAGHRFHTKSDVEVIVHAYEDDGVDCLGRLRGMFAFALWDARRQRLMLARDRFGIKSLHYAIAGDALYFGSEMKAILASGSVTRELDVHALDEFFRLGFVRSPRTLLRTIRGLRPGEYLIAGRGAVSTHTYWRPHFPARDEPRPRMRADAWAERLAAKLQETVRIHLRSDVPIGAWISAGVDSSGVAALTQRLTNRPVPTFTLTFSSPEYDEVRGHKTLDQFPGYDLPNERVVCGAGAFDLYPKALWHLETPTVGGTEVPRLLLSEASSRHVKVVMAGEGSDEIFGGYPWLLWDRVFGPLARLPVPLRRFLLRGAVIPGWHERLSQAFLAPPAMSWPRYERMVGMLGSERRVEVFSAGLRERLAAAGADGLQADVAPPGTRFAAMQYYDMTSRLPDRINHVVDRSSMAHGVEVRVPFLDHELVELTAQIPEHLKLRGWQEKYILRRALRGVLPPEILYRRKRGFQTPYQQWLRDPLPAFAEDLLSTDCLRDKGYFVPSVVHTMLRQHREARSAWHGALLMAVLAIQTWDELFLQARGPY